MTENEWVEFVRTISLAEKKGVITYSEYLHMISLITKVRRGGY